MRKRRVAGGAVSGADTARGSESVGQLLRLAIGVRCLARGGCASRIWSRRLE